MSRIISHAFYILIALWIIHAVQFFLFSEIGQYGIYPRSISGLTGIITAPWIHHSWWHLISNSIPFLILGTLVQLKSSVIFLESTLIIVLLSGIGTWIFGSPAYHAGASALILGYWSFLLTDAYNTKSIKAILFGSVAVVMYGGFLFILLDVRTHISWVGHASGLVAGIIAANLYFNSENSSAKD